MSNYNTFSQACCVKIILLLLNLKQIWHSITQNFRVRWDLKVATGIPSEVQWHMMISEWYTDPNSGWKSGLYLFSSYLVGLFWCFQNKSFVYHMCTTCQPGVTICQAPIVFVLLLCFLVCPVLIFLHHLVLFFYPMSCQVSLLCDCSPHPQCFICVSSSLLE